MFTHLLVRLLVQAFILLSLYLFRHVSDFSLNYFDMESYQWAIMYFVCAYIFYIFFIMTPVN